MSMNEARRRISHVKEHNLTELDLGKCNLTQLPDELKEIGARLTRLDLTHNNVGSEGAAFIARYCPSLQSLKLGTAYYDKYRGWIASGNDIGDKGAKAIATITGLAHLEICHNHIGYDGARAIATLTGLAHLDISDNQIGYDGAKAIATLTGLVHLGISRNQIGYDGAKAIAALSALTHLDISKNQIGHDGTKAIAAITGLAHLDISQNQIGNDGAEAIATLARLTSLYTAINYIGDEGAKAIATLSRLAHLDISENQIGDEGTRAMAALTGLAHLDISHNKIGYNGAKAIAVLTELSHLDICANKIGGRGAKAIAALSGLAYLEISSNQIGDDGAKAIAALSELAHLEIRYNQIGYEGAKAIAALTGLAHLDIRSNQLGGHGAKAIAALTSLAHLDISSNQIGDEGAKAIAAITNLTYLYISDNNIYEEGAKAIAAITNLAYLDIRSNKIGDEGAKAIAAITNLAHLDIRSNNIGDEGAKAIAAIINLANLYISSNNIGDDGAKAIAAIINLAHLDISSNQIGDDGAKAIVAIINLAHLDISSNNIGEDGAKAIAAITNVAYLNISSNNIGEDGAKAIAAITNLAHLDIRHNNIGDGGLKALALSPHLQTSNVYISNNNPKNIPKDVAEDIEALRNYFNAGETTRYIPNNVMRIILCGNTHAGKTSLATKLENINNPNPKKEERTHGIKHWHITPSEKNRQLNLNIWDFGGQDYYHATHAASLTSSDKENDNKYTIYLLVWRNPKPEIKDGKDVEEMQQFHEDYWLGFIQLLADKPSVDIIQTHVDEKDNPISFPTSELKHKHFALDPINYHYLSLDDNAVLTPKWNQLWTRFETYLYDKITEKINSNRQEIPTTWKEIREKVLPDLIKKQAIISKTELENYLLNRDIIKQYKGKEEEALGFTGLMAYLKGCGEILVWGDDKPALKDKVVIDIQKFHETIYTKMLTEKVRTDKGVFPATEKHKFYVDYLLHNELVFKKSNEGNAYIAPQYLPAEPLIAHFKDLIPLTLVLRYPYYMPRYLITRCIVKVYNQNNETDYWKYGCISTWNNGDTKTKFMIAINPAPDKQEVYFYIQDTKDTYPMLKKLYVFFSSFGAEDIWPENAFQSDGRDEIKLLQIVPERITKENDGIENIKDALQLSTDGEIFVNVGDIKQAVKHGQPTVKTVDNKYTRMDIAMQQLVDPEAKDPKKIFFSYSRYDRQYREEFEVHFAPLKRRGLIATWYDGELDAGEDANAVIMKELLKADIIICLLSPRFMANDYIWNIEMQKAKEHKKTIVPVTLKRCDYKKYFADFFEEDKQGFITQKQFDPEETTGKTKKHDIIWIASEQHEAKRDEYYAFVVEELKKIIER